MASILTHIYVTQLRWIKPLSASPDNIIAITPERHYGSYKRDAHVIITLCHIPGQEINQRVIRSFVDEDQELFTDMINSLEELKLIYYGLLDKIATRRTYISHKYRLLQKRVEFHRHQALAGIELVISDGFTRWATL